MYKRMIAILLILGVLVCFSGCRMRIIDDSLQADVILKDEQTQITLSTEPSLNIPESEPTEPTTQTEDIPPDETETPATQPPVVAPPQTETDTDQDRPEAQPTGPEGDTTEPSNTGSGDGNGPGTDGEDSSETGDGPGNNTPTEPEPTIKVTLNANGGRAPARNIMVSEGGTYAGLSDATRSGYTFVGWFTEKTGGTQIYASSTVISNENHTLYAHWSNKPGYIVSFDATTGWLGAQESARTVFSGQSYGNPFPSPTGPMGYRFLGWFDSKNGGNQISHTDTFTGNTDKTLYAQWLYDPVAYWSGYLQNAPIYECQILRVYIEYDEDHVTTSYSPLISMTQSINAARTFSETHTTDAQVRAAAPAAIVKCVSNMGNAAQYYSDMSARFPGKKIFVLPQSAEWGSSAQKIYYALYLAKLLYPEALGHLDMNYVAGDLGVSGSIYY